jgi:MerR family transcriptional regulator, light-induced transcriptional regulator
MVDNMQMETMNGFPIKVAARRTGLSTHVIRVWERRYGAVTPVRTDTNRRLYSEADIERLRLLQRATAGGHSIGQIAQLPVEELERLVVSDGVPDGPERAPRPRPELHVTPAALLEACLDATRQLDAASLDRHLARAEISLSLPELLDDLIVPFMEEIGCEWREGSMRVANEHMASATIRSFLGGLYRSYQIDETAPEIIVTTPPGQNHEFGALLVAVVVAAEGWRVVYLGPNLPVEEAVGAAQAVNARAVALSMLYPSDDPKLAQELAKLGRIVPEGCAVIAGGKAAAGYKNALDRIGAITNTNLRDLRDSLAKLRSAGPAQPVEEAS